MDHPISTTATPSRVDPRFAAGVAVAILLVASLLIRLNHLGHGAIKGLDESFHAVVAKNLAKNPLRPTLYDRPWLAYDYRDWQSNHVWLHKPPVPMWQMALSMAVLGVNTLAMRLPSALLATAAVYLTYAIGREVLNDRRAALIGAAFQAASPAITSLVHGYVFSDHIDVAFLFWVELSVYCLVRAIRSGSTRWTILAGAAQGVAYLAKTYPAFVVSGIALVAIVLPLVGTAASDATRLRWRHLGMLIAATLLTVAPWTIWCIIHFPREFWWEQAQVFRHLGSDVEGWAAPWDRLVFDFSLRIYDRFYPAVLVAMVVLGARAARAKDLGLWLLLAWALGVLIPHVIATSKTPTATLIGWPPCWLLLGAMIARAIDGDRACLAGWLATALLAVFAARPIRQVGWGYPEVPGFARILRDNAWVLAHVLAALGVVAAVAMLGRRLVLRGRNAARVRIAVVALSSLASLFLFVRIARQGWSITQLNRQRPSFVELGALVRSQLPHNVVLLLENTEKCEHIMLMFHADRSVYPVTPDNGLATAQKVADAGAIPLLVTHRSLTLPRVFDEPGDGRAVYAMPPFTQLPATATSPTTLP